MEGDGKFFVFPASEDEAMCFSMWPRYLQTVILVCVDIC